MRAQPAQNLAHLDGAGIAKANLLTRATGAEQVAAMQAAAPGRFTWFASADVGQPASIDTLTQAVKSGARGFGEMKFHYSTDGPEFRRVYALAAELNVPILIHFQEVDHFENEGTWSSGFATKFEAVLKAFPKTSFIGHADAFWANVSADYHNEAAYPADRSYAAASPIGCLAIIQICTAICRPTRATTCCRATPRSRASFSAAIKTS
jgi:predicted TIM-barrel fold metal-dependent hydrolase